MSQQRLATATIAAGASESDVVDLHDWRLAGLLMPAAWTAASVTLLAADDEAGPWLPLHGEDGTELAVTVAASRAVALDGAGHATLPFQYVKLRSGTAALPVVQAAERVLQLVLR